MPAAENRARDLAQRLAIVDTHIDVPYRLTEEMQDISQRTPDGDFDYPRARQGGLDIAFMSIYVPADYQQGGARQFADELIDMVGRIAGDAPEKFSLITNLDQARRLPRNEKVGLALGMENGAPIEGRLSNLRHFYDRGIRYITLTHSRNNHICDSSYDEERKWNGLSPFGVEIVAEMNRLGMMIDVSHVSDEAFFQVLEQTTAPVIASHSSCRHFTPGWERNLSDEMIRKLGQNGGVVQINFGSAFISDRYRLAWVAARDEIAAQLAEQGIDPTSTQGKQAGAALWKQRHIEVADIAEVVDHIDHVVQLVGVDHVGLGSDYDGVGDSLPRGLEDVGSYPNLIGALLDRGYTEQDVEKICSGNLFRVWGEVERRAAELQRAVAPPS